ncbi:MAG: glycosyltransferase, partial [candidate division WOR-3 bacterium]|nr:glycosyltransferase [candidate division WOR-3 bacterium]
ADIPANTHIERLGIFGKILESEINKLVLDENLFYVFTSPGYINYYQKYGINSEKVFIFENCPESRLFSSHDWSNNIIQKERITVGYIGAVAYYKSLKTLMKAASNMNEVEVFIAGKGPQSELIKREAKKYPNVFVYGHYDYEKEIVDLYKRVDIVYSVYNTDNFNVRLALPN